ncbi:MAG TPA: VTT domain-containing protein [Bryobacteraceae bacterium]|jgi:membrane protein DedA with SNARE-associated domain/rhodanese-related sulfurtransferase|nr:VTT domain-containing protein [Bryobacteraceae bacterium]
MNATAEFVIRHGYAVLFFWILAEQGALPIPSVPLLLVCGALTKSGRLSAVIILLLGIAACAIADSVWFELGRRRGSKILGLLCRLAIEPDSCVRQTENGFVKYGPRFLLISKFVPGINALAAPLAGTARVRWSSFLVFDSLGAAFFIGAWTTAGYLLSEQLEIVGDVVGRAGFRLFLAIVIVVGGWIGWKYFQRRRFFRKLAVARIFPEELQSMLDAGREVAVIDVRGGLVLYTPPIPGTLRIPLSEMAERHKEVPRDRDVVLFCSCPNEASAARAALILRKHGITRVRPLVGGADAWSALAVMGR